DVCSSDLIGYSLNDTVVVFDRIREFVNEHTTWHFDKIVNSSLSSTLSRTLNTSLTTLVVLLAIFIFGGDSIRGFMFALIVGVVRSEEHTSELQSRENLVCRLLLEKK